MIAGRLLAPVRRAFPVRQAPRADRAETRRRAATIACGAAAAVLACIGVPGTLGIALILVGAACAVGAVVFVSTVPALVLLGIVVAGAAMNDPRPSALLLAALTAAITAFLLVPVWRRGDTSGLAALAGIPLAAAVTLLAEHTGRGTALFVIGLGALVGAFVLALLPAMRRLGNDR